MNHDSLFPVDGPVLHLQNTACKITCDVYERCKRDFERGNRNKLLGWLRGRWG